MTMRNMISIVIATIVVLSTFAGRAPAGIPDLTKGEGPGLETASKQDWHLHLAGCRGWIIRGEFGNPDKARQILVTKVPTDSSVRRRLKVGDVILGVNGRYFSKHAVYEFRETSRPAETAYGKVPIILWRKSSGKETQVVLDLAPLPLDFTKGDKPGKGVDWNLGATGARGWMHGVYDETFHARQILITRVHEGSPAESILRKGDVILGVEGKRFDRDARKAFGKALTRAETRRGKGQLRLLRWREGETREVVIQIPVMGSYSKTTPWKCKKSQKILDNACAYLV